MFPFFAPTKFEEQRIEQWQREWAEKGESRAIAHRKMLEAVLAHPDNDPEKALRKTLHVRETVAAPTSQSKTLSCTVYKFCG